jgi:hypothetical protein
MCQCSSASEIFSPTIRLSVHTSAEAEAQRHKWIASEKAGRDLGEWAILSWIREHWRGYLRKCWLEHLEGKTYWIELDPADFGLLLREISNSTLFAEILKRLKGGWENLDIIWWALDIRHDMEEVHRILLTLDINSLRIDCQIAKRLAQAG